MPEDRDSVLVLAGDIAPIALNKVLRPFLIDVARRFRAVCYVAGNHEYYDSIWPHALGQLKGWGLPDNVHVLDRQCVTIDDVTFLGTTLWTDMDQGDAWTMRDAQQMLADYRAIRLERNDESDNESGNGNGNGNGNAPLTPTSTVRDHHRSRQWLQRELAKRHQEQEKTVLITHHGLTPQSVHPRFNGNPLNGAFVSDLSDLLNASPPLYAIHGHTHDSFDYTLDGGTRVVTNPRGYARNEWQQENDAFDPTLRIVL